MIRVNLLKSKISNAEEAETEGIAFTGDDSQEPINKQQLIVKVFLILLAPIVVYFYEDYNLDQLLRAKSGIQTQLNQGTTKLNQLKVKAGKAQEVEGEVQKLEEKLKILVELSRKRLRELKALDSLQNMIPDSVWVESLDYDGENFQLLGGALNDKGLNDFVVGLEESPYYQNVIVLRAIEKKALKGTVKEFEIASVLGELN